MKGIVEIYKGNSLLPYIQEGNLVVDGASEVLVDLLTTSPGYSENPNLSSIMDTSNYTVQAITFGQDIIAVSSNAHADTRPVFSLNSNVSSFFVGHGNVPNLHFFSNGGASAVGYSSIVGLIPVGTPVDKVLVNNTFQGIGHMVNAWEFSSHFGLMSGIDVAKLGCYGGRDASTAIDVSQIGGSSLGFERNRSPFNQRGSIDAEGYIGLVNNLSGLQSNSTTDPSGGLIVSTLNTFSAAGGTQIIYKVHIGSPDMNVLNLYGGVWAIGLWVIDVNKALEKGLTFPLAYNRSGPFLRPYKLFAKKIFSRNITGYDNYIPVGSTNTLDFLRLIWRINF